MTNQFTLASRVLPLYLVISSVGVVFAQQTSGPDAGPPPGSEILLRQPSAPAELFEAVVLTAERGELDLSAYYLKGLLDAQADAKTLAQLREQAGPVVLMRLAKQPKLQPMADALREQMDAAMRAAARDPERLESLVPYLSASTGERAWAIAQLRRAGPAAVPTLLAVLRDESRQAEHAGAIEALERLDSSATAALLGALSTPDAGQQLMVLDLLTQRRDRAAAPFLWALALVPSVDAQVRAAAAKTLLALGTQQIAPSTAVALLLTEAEQCRQGRLPFRVASDGTVELWGWDAQQQTLVSQAAPKAMAMEQLSAAFTFQALIVAPQNRDVQSAWLELLLQRDAAQAKLGAPMPTGAGSGVQFAKVHGTLLSDLTKSAMREGHTRVVHACVQALGAIGDGAVVYGDAEHAGVLVRALRYPDRRVQFDAAEAILGLAPQRPFVGASEMVETLARASRLEGPAALVADSNFNRGQELAGLLRQLGYRTDVAETGKEAFRSAAASADYEMILVDPNIQRWELTSTLANLAGDTRCAGVPKYLVAPLDWQPALKRRLAVYSDLRFLVRPATKEDLLVQLRPTGLGEASPPLSAEERQHYAERARKRLVALRTDPAFRGSVVATEPSLARETSSTPSTNLGALPVP